MADGCVIALDPWELSRDLGETGPYRITHMDQLTVH